MEVSGVGVGYTAWQSTPTSGAGATWAVSTTQGRSRGQCGLYVTDGSTQVTVTLDRDAATGTLGLVQPGRQHPQRAVHDPRRHRRRAVPGRRRRRAGGAPRRPTGRDGGRPGAAPTHRPWAWPRTVMRRAATSTTSPSRRHLDGPPRRPSRRHRGPRGPGCAAGDRDPAPAMATGGGSRGGGHPGRAGHRAGRPGRGRGQRPRAAAGGRLPGHDPRGRGRVRPGRRVRRRGPAGRPASRGRPDRLLLGVFLLAALVTAVLSLDATVVLLTPIVVGAAAALGMPDRPGAFACLRMANSALAAAPGLQPHQPAGDALPRPRLRRLRAAGWRRCWLVVLVVEYVGLRLLYRGDLAVQPTRARRTSPARRCPSSPSSWSR